MVEPTAHNGSDAGSTAAGPTNLSPPELVDWLLAHFDARKSEDDLEADEWWHAVLSNIGPILSLAKEGARGVCEVDLTNAPVLGYMLSNIEDRIRRPRD